MKRQNRILAALCLCSVVMSVLPQQVSAAGEPLTKELDIMASSEQDYKEQAESAFAMEIEEDGQKYERAEIRYEVTNTNYLDKKEKMIETADPAETVTEDGVEYTLVKFEEPKEIEQTVTAYDDYDHAVTAADVPATKDTVITNEAGEQETVTCNLTGVSPAGTATVDNVMTITFSNYDAAYYEYNGSYIARDDQTPPIAGYENQLLSQAGAAAGSVITSCSWSGQPYSVDGVMYRDAVANVRQLVQMYRANYEGTVSVQDPDATGQAYYSAPDPDGDVELTVTATATYLPVQISFAPYILAGAGILVLAALVVIILMTTAKKRNKEEKISKER